ncbi:unnamed protein product [Tenebrio molitor]|nr:unnamed protein product [Tenebrio molitor]
MVTWRRLSVAWTKKVTMWVHLFSPKKCYDFVIGQGL